MGVERGEGCGASGVGDVTGWLECKWGRIDSILTQRALLWSINKKKPFTSLHISMVTSIPNEYAKHPHIPQ